MDSELKRRMRAAIDSAGGRDRCTARAALQQLTNPPHAMIAAMGDDYMRNYNAFVAAVQSQLKGKPDA